MHIHANGQDGHGRTGRAHQWSEPGLERLFSDEDVADAANALDRKTDRVLSGFFSQSTDRNIEVAAHAVVHAVGGVAGTHKRPIGLFDEVPHDFPLYLIQLYRRAIGRIERPAVIGQIPCLELAALRGRWRRFARALPWFSSSGRGQNGGGQFQRVQRGVGARIRSRQHRRDARDLVREL